MRISVKYFLISLNIMFLLSACTNRNAFSALNIVKEQELAIENTRSGKIMFKKNIKGIYSLVYLNNVYPQMDSDTHQFYIATYLKDNTEDNTSITLDQKHPLEVIKLEDKNKYSDLLPMKNTWTSNYLVSFKNEGELHINLVIDSGQFSSGPLKYLTDQR